MKLRSSLFAVCLGLGIQATGCGDDTPFVPGDGNGSGSSDGGPTDGSFTAYVIDLVKNHSMDPAPKPYAEFSTLPDPDADANNVHAYDTLFM